MDNVAEQVMTVQQVRDRLRFGDMSLVAKRAGRTVGHVSQVLSGKRPDRKVAVAVARLLRVRLDALPPELYASGNDTAA